MLTTSVGSIKQREPNQSIVSLVSYAVFPVYQDMCTKHGPKLTQTSLISKPRVVFHIRVKFELSIGYCKVLKTAFDN